MFEGLKRFFGIESPKARQPKVLDWEALKAKADEPVKKTVPVDVKPVKPTLTVVEAAKKPTPRKTPRKPSSKGNGAKCDSDDTFVTPAVIFAATDDSSASASTYSPSSSYHGGGGSFGGGGSSGSWGSDSGSSSSSSDSSSSSSSSDGGGGGGGGGD